MDKFILTSIEDLGDKIIKAYQNCHITAEFSGVSVIAHFETIISVLNWLTKHSEYKMYDIKLCAGEVDGYYDEYILSIDPCGNIWCQEAKFNNNYVQTSSDFCFIHSDCNSQVQIKNESIQMIEFEIS